MKNLIFIFIIFPSLAFCQDYSSSLLFKGDTKHDTCTAVLAFENSGIIINSRGELRVYGVDKLYVELRRFLLEVNYVRYHYDMDMPRKLRPIERSIIVDYNKN